MSGRPMTHSAACLGKVVVWPIPRRRLDALAGSVPRVALRLAHVTACREARLQDHFVNIAGREARERVAHFLMELFQRIRHRPPASGDHVLIPLTLSHIGEALNLTEVHVSRTLRTLRIQGVVRFFRQKLDVLDAQAFTRAAGSMGETETFGDELAADLPSRE